MVEKKKADRVSQLENIKSCAKGNKRFTLREICPYLSSGQLKRLGVALSKYGVKRVGSKVTEGYLIVNAYQPQDVAIIKKFAEKMYHRKSRKI